MNSILKSVLVTALLYTCSAEPYCTTPPAGDKDLIFFLPNKFSTRVEITTDGKESSDVEMNFDYERRKAAITLETRNTRTDLIFNYETDEIYLVESLANVTSDAYPGQYDPLIVKGCTTYSLSETKDLNEYFGANVEIVDGVKTVKPNSVYQIFHYKDFPTGFLGREYVRGYNNSEFPYPTSGIPCDAWLSCEYNLDEKTNYTVTNYITNGSEFEMPYPNSQYKDIPVRTYIKGVREENGKLIDYEINREYYKFKPLVVRESAFQTPPGVVCNGRKKTKATPSLLQQFKISGEMTNKAGETNHLRNFIYDGVRKAVKYELRPLRPNAEYTVTDKISIIHDYNTGISFTRNLIHSNCSIGPISFNSFDEDSNFTDITFHDVNAKILKLNSPENILQLNSEYIYTGPRKSRNIPTDMFVSDRSEVEKTTVYSEYAFSKEGFSFVTRLGNIDQIPLSIHRTSPQNIHMNDYLHFYAFEPGMLDVNEFDTSMCYQKADKFEVRVTFPYKNITSKEAINSVITALPDIASDLLVTKLNESFTRFTKPVLGASEDGNLYMRFTILPSPPTLAFYTEIPGVWLLSGYVDYMNDVVKVEDCARFCLDHLNCLSFDYSSSAQKCFLNSKHSSEANVGPSTGYSHYSRNTLEGSFSRPIYVLYSMINEFISNQNFTLISPIESSEFFQLKASSIIDVKDGGNREGTTSALRTYSRKFPNSRLNSNIERTYMDLTIDNCAKKCSDELKFECTTFDFSYIDGSCRLSKTTALKTDVSEDFVSDVYEKTALFHYKKFQAKTTIKMKDKTFGDITTPNDCAKKCDNELSIHCRSFNYCPDSNACSLSSSHLVDGTESDASESDLLCEHYSRDYLSDFLYTSTSTIRLEADLEVSDSTPEDCAKACVNVDGFECRSFDYCAKKKKCLINKGMGMSKPESGDNTDSCMNYRREYYSTTTKYANLAAKDNSGSVLAGLSFLFTLLGLGVGITATLVYFKKKNN